MGPEPRLPRPERGRGTGRRRRAGRTGADPRPRRHGAGRRAGRRTRTPDRQRRDRRHRRSRRSPRRRTGAARPPRLPAGNPGRHQRPRARLQRPASPASPAARCWRSPRDGSSVRTLAKSKPQPGAPVKTTIDPDLQEAAVSALAGRSGGVAVLDTRKGDVRALAGQAFSAPQPPGSTFKVVTTTAALEAGEVSLDDEFEITDGVNVGGRFLNNANGEFCGGTFRESFAESCNAVFAPLGPAVGNDKLVETAEAFGFNSPPTLYAPQHRQRSRPRGIDDPDRDRRRNRPRRLGDRPGRSAGDAAGDGERRADRRQRRRPPAELDRRSTRSCGPTPSRCG